jgi:predicted NBD/HSP70 family sugar kinase
MVRALNRRLILNHIRQDGPVSRAKLVELTGLSPAAVTAVTAELIGTQFLLERAVGQSSGGRPPVLLDLDYGAHYAVGLKLMESRLVGVLTDLSTRSLHQASVELAGTSVEQVAAQAVGLSRDLFARTRAPQERMIGAGLGLAGVIDAARGVCHSSPYLGWRDVPIADLIARDLGTPVWIDNDVNAFATAERLFGHGKRAQNFVVVTVGRGIGAGLVLGGELYRGRDGGAGEFGHTVTEPGGRRCECGNTGCLEAYASEPALIARYNEQGKRAVHNIEALLERARKGDQIANALLEDGGRRVGQGLATIVNLLNPELIVVGGEGVRLGDRFFAAMRAALETHAFNGLARGLEVVVDAWGDDAWARGAAGLAVQRAFDLSGV